MRVEIPQRIGGLDDDGRLLALVEDLEQLEDEDENGLVLLPDELLDQNADDVLADDLVDAVSVLGKGNEGPVCIGADFDDRVLEELADCCQEPTFVLAKCHAAELGAGDLDHGAGGKLSDDLVLLVEAGEQFGHEVGLRLVGDGPADPTAVRELLIDLLQDLRP